MKLRYIYIIVLCILTSGCNYLDIMPDERAKLEDSYNTPSKTANAMNFWIFWIKPKFILKPIGKYIEQKLSF